MHLLQDLIWGGCFLVVERIPESEIGCFKKKTNKYLDPRDGEFPVAAPTMTWLLHGAYPAWLAPTPAAL